MNQLEQTITYLNLSDYNQTPFIKKTHTLTKIRSEYITLSLITLTSLFLLFSAAGHFALGLLVVYLYPLYKTFQAIESKIPHDTDRWLIYWAVFGFTFSLLSFVSLFVKIPAQNLILSIFCFSVYSKLIDGQTHLYSNFLKPLFVKYEKTIDKYVEMSKEEMKDVSKRIKREELNKKSD